MKRISIVTPCYNEEENVGLLYEKVKEVMGKLEDYSYEHIFIDNASEDKTVPILKEIAARDPKVKIIVNSRNFGHIRSPYHALLQATGDAVISVVADLQDPPELIPTFLKKWEEGYKIVIGVKKNSEESPLFFAVRKMYYNLVSKLSEIKLVKNFTGFGLYDKKIIEILRQVNDPYPYFRGLICDIGFERAEIEYIQPVRKRGFTKNNFYTLYDIGMLGITNHSKVPLRLAAMLGFGVAILSLLVALIYLIAKLIFWNSFNLGTAPLVIGLFFFSSVQLFFSGILGEYIGAIHTQVLNRPLVVEKERVNFENDPEK
ncbi:MAG TPA: glycosyltransferase [Bacillota bacterium]|nr:glycosyltransferase [Bacillota bacterium]